MSKSSSLSSQASPSVLLTIPKFTTSLFFVSTRGQISFDILACLEPWFFNLGQVFLIKDDDLSIIITVYFIKQAFCLLSCPSAALLYSEFKTLWKKGVKEKWKKGWPNKQRAFWSVNPFKNRIFKWINQSRVMRPWGSALETLRKLLKKQIKSRSWFFDVNHDKKVSTCMQKGTRSAQWSIYSAQHLRCCTWTFAF